jgi:acyl-CoA thioester hydrolase
MMTPAATARLQPFTWSVRVYYEDTDTGGIVYYANYLKFFERARTEWLRAAGFEQRILADRHGLQFVVAEVALQYARPARLDDIIEIDVRVSHLARVSLVFEQTARRGADVIATARVKAACIDSRRFCPAPMPEDMRAAFATLNESAS